MERSQAKSSRRQVLVGRGILSRQAYRPMTRRLDNAGAAFVFARTANVWNALPLLAAPNADSDDEFGDSVAVSGGTIVVGTSGESSAATKGLHVIRINRAAENNSMMYVIDEHLLDLAADRVRSL